MDIYVLYIVIGFFIGILLGIFGIGGGMIIVFIMFVIGYFFEEFIGIFIL